MRKLLAFLVLVIAVISIMDRTHTPPNIATADTSKVTAKTRELPKIEAAEYVEPVVETVPTYTRAGGCEQYRNLIAAHDWDVRIMMAVMEAESTNRETGYSCDSGAVGDKNPINGVLAVSCGLFQVRTIAPWRGTCEQLQDPAFNIDIAYKIYQGQGMAAWSAYANGSYLQNLR